MCGITSAQGLEGKKLPEMCLECCFLWYCLCGRAQIDHEQLQLSIVNQSLSFTGTPDWSSELHKEIQEEKKQMRGTNKTKVRVAQVSLF